jgi:hypothetical protein
MPKFAVTTAARLSAMVAATALLAAAPPPEAGLHSRLNSLRIRTASRELMARWGQQMPPSPPDQSDRNPS